MFNDTDWSQDWYSSILTFKVTQILVCISLPLVRQYFSIFTCKNANHLSTQNTGKPLCQPARQLQQDRNVITAAICFEVCSCASILQGGVIPKYMLHEVYFRFGNNKNIGSFFTHRSIIFKGTSQTQLLKAHFKVWVHIFLFDLYQDSIFSFLSI